MIIHQNNKISRGKKNLVRLFLIAVLTTSFFIAIYQFNYIPIRGHSPFAVPKEIYSMYNSTIVPTIDGKIEFNATIASLEWGSAAIYDMYDSSENTHGKIFLQNDDSYLYVGFDMIDFEVEDPATIWGAGIFFDLNHNGILDLNDGCVSVLTEANESLHVDVYRGQSNGEWDLLATGTTGTEIPTYNVTVEMDYSTTFFDQTNSHRQYEFKIDLDTLGKNPGDIFGIGFEATAHFNDATAGVVWPYIDGVLNDIRTNAHFWGDIYLGEDGVYTKYVIEDNFVIKNSAFGSNNGSFFATGDIDGDTDLELIVSSNRTVSGDTNLIAIYDTNTDGDVYQMWNSWTSTHSSSLFVAQGIECYDFDGNGEDEIYIVSSHDSRVLQLRDWNTVSGDFDTLGNAFDNIDNTMGYIAIGDATNDGTTDILIGDGATSFVVLEFDKIHKPFTKWTNNWYVPFDINGSAITRIHALAIGESDHDIYGVNEILMLTQFSADDSISSTGLQIFEIYSTSIYDNPTADPTFGYEDDLPIGSHNNTFDSFGHTILVEDIDNDGIHETVIVGKDYLKIFGHDTFNDTDIPLVLDINDETYPSMGGGAGVVDIDGDGYNELIVGCNNGTTFVYQLIDLNPDDAIEDLLLITEWKGDLGTIPGKRESIIGFDIDGDGVDEAIIGDNFGQIIVLGMGETPSITMTSPSYGYTTNRDAILFEWDISNDSLPIVFYDIYISSIFSMRIGGAQRGVVIPLTAGDNHVIIVCTDIQGSTDSDAGYVKYVAGSPTIDITSPEDGSKTTSSTIALQYDTDDPAGMGFTFTIYVNDTVEGTTANHLFSFNLDSAGTWNITVVAEDGLGVKVRDMIHILYDNTGPVISITSPADYTVVSSTTINLQWSAYDEYTSIDYYEIYREGTLQGNTTTKSFEVDLPLEIDYTIVVIAYDILGNTDSDTIHVTRDTINPTVDLLDLSYPTNYAGWYYTDSTDLFIEWDGSDSAGGSGIDYYEVLVEETQYDIYLADAINDTITLAGEGPNDVEVIVYDLAGNSDSDSYIVAYDVSDPEVTITSPENNHETSAENVTIFWDASDVGAGIETIEVIVEGTIEATFTDPTTNSYFVDIPDTKVYEITVRVTDFLGNTGQDTIYVEHDPVIPTLMISVPLEEFSYSNSTFIDISWEIINITPEGFIVIINGTEYPYTPTTFETAINLEDVFGIITEDNYPIANITVVAIVGGVNLYPDTKFVQVDFTNPNVAISSPINLQTISEDSLEITWTGDDLGSGLVGYSLWINETYIGSWDDTVTSQIVDVASYSDGLYEIILEAQDVAENSVNTSIYINLFPSDPEFTIDLPSTILTNDPNFQMTISITNPSSGIQEVFVLADNSEIVYYINYNSSYQVDPYDVIVDVVETDFVAPTDEHNLTITIYDRGGRSASKIVDVIIDNEEPTLYNPILDSTALNFGAVSIEISGSGSNLHNFTLSTTDPSGIQQASLQIFNENNSFSYTMILDVALSTDVIFVYDASVDFSDYTEGTYFIQIQITDNAGNMRSQSYSLLVSFEQQIVPTPTPSPTPTTPGSGASQWILDHLYTVIIPSVSGILVILIIAIILSATVRRRGTNRGWREVIEAVAYVTKTGLTVAFVPYAEDLFDDEQLFGGALTGIVSILGEITGETEVEMKVQTMEYGGKRLLVCSGIFGNAILLVSDVKPILKDLVMKFILEFELTYKFNLGEELINLNDFNGVSVMVESYFGARSDIIKSIEASSATQEDNFDGIPLEPQYTEEETPQYIPETTDDTTDYTITYSEPTEVNYQEEEDQESFDENTDNNRW